MFQIYICQTHYGLKFLVKSWVCIATKDYLKGIVVDKRSRSSLRVKDIKYVNEIER